MPEPTFPCPNPRCRLELAVGSEECSACGMCLSGPDAARLWQVNQQIVALTDESAQLVARLLRPASTRVPAMLGSPGTQFPTDDTSLAAAPFVGDPYPTTIATSPATARKSPSGQQLLLGLGALLLLSASAFFLFIVWSVVGIIGQALIMATVTGAAVAGSVMATKRGLSAAAETAAMIATGLLVIDLTAAHGLNLAGLGALPVDRYWAAAAVLGAALLVGWDRLVPRTQDGNPLRRVLVYRPAATLLLAVAPWCLLSALTSNGAPVAGLGLVALTSAALGVAALGFDEPLPQRAGTVTVVPRLPLSTFPLFGSAAVAFLMHLISGLQVGYEVSGDLADRYAVFGMLLLGPVLCAVLSSRAGARIGISEGMRSRLPMVATLWAVPVFGIPFLDLPYTVMVAASVVLGAVAVGVHLGWMTGSSPVRAAWRTALAGVVFVAQPLLCAVVYLLAENRERTLADAATFTPSLSATPAVLLVLVPVSVWAATACVAVVRLRSRRWVLTAQVSVLSTVIVALRDADATLWLGVSLCAVAANVALGRVAVRRAATGKKPAPPPQMTDAKTPRLAATFWDVTDVSAVLFGGIYTSIAIAHTYSVETLSLVLVTAGVLTLLYAASPHRLAFAYLGSLSISAGTAVLSWQAHIEAIEVYTGPLVLLLAGIGFVQWTRDHKQSTTLTMGPALSAAMGPTLLVAIGTGDNLRLLILTTFAVVALLVGLTRQWKAPVATSSLVLAAIAFTQGGPFVAYVPGWLILGVAGAALLTAGVAWERAVNAGRVANRWFHTLN